MLFSSHQPQHQQLEPDPAIYWNFIGLPTGWIISIHGQPGQMLLTWHKQNITDLKENVLYFYTSLLFLLVIHIDTGFMKVLWKFSTRSDQQTNLKSKSRFITNRAKLYTVENCMDSKRAVMISIKSIRQCVRGLAKQIRIKSWSLRKIETESIIACIHTASVRIFPSLVQYSTRLAHSFVLSIIRPDRHVTSSFITLFTFPFFISCC